MGAITVQVLEGNLEFKTDQESRHLGNGANDCFTRKYHP
jgi:hypothetical protein